MQREVFSECLTLALQAPSASGTQGWRWIFVDDPEKKRALAEIYRANLAAAGKPQAANHPINRRSKHGWLPPEHIWPLIYKTHRFSSSPACRVGSTAAARR